MKMSSIQLQAEKPVQFSIPSAKPASKKILTLLSKYKPEFDFILECERERVLIILENMVSLNVSSADAQELVEDLRRQIEKPNVS